MIFRHCFRARSEKCYFRRNPRPILSPTTHSLTQSGPIISRFRSRSSYIPRIKTIFIFQSKKPLIEIEISGHKTVSRFSFLSCFPYCMYCTSHPAILAILASKSRSRRPTGTCSFKPAAALVAKMFFINANRKPAKQDLRVHIGSTSQGKKGKREKRGGGEGDLVEDQQRFFDANEYCFFNDD